jgi:hypothetical protein
MVPGAMILDTADNSGDSVEEHHELTSAVTKARHSLESLDGFFLKPGRCGLSRADLSVDRSAIELTWCFVTNQFAIQSVLLLRRPPNKLRYFCCPQHSVC